MGNNPREFFSLCGQYPIMSTIWKTRLKKAIEDKGLGMKEASLLAGKGETFVRDLLERDRIPSIENFLTLARIVGQPAAYLLGEENEKQPEVGLRRVQVAAHVQAGHFVEAWEWDDEDKYSVFVPDLPEYRNLRLYGAELRGTSMNKRYADKTVVVFNSIAESYEDPIPGKRYVIERKRTSGEMEHTVKLLHADTDGKFWLMPESDDPKYQGAISIEDGTGDEDEVVIVGRVLFAVTRE